MSTRLPGDRTRSLATRSRFRIGGQSVQPDRLLVTVDGQDIALEPRVMEVLVALAEHAGEVVSAEQLLIEVWRGTFYGDNPVHKAIAHLRKVLGDDPKSPRYIETIRKRGYRLLARVSRPDDYRRASVPAATWRGASPYVGLAAFDREHADVFFGRSRATAELLAAMRHQIDNQRRFLLIVGASGCGKTSLLNAGAIPLLRQEGGFDGMRALAIATCDLAGIDAGDALSRLAAALSNWILGDRPVFPPGPVADLVDTLRRAPTSIPATVAEALRRCPPREAADAPHAHLLLTIDHAEALVAGAAHERCPDPAFSTALHALCESPHVMVTMIVRSDFYPTLVDAYPEIAERKLGEGHFDVLTPRPGDIARIIRGPAALAGLGFEEDPQTGEHLDDVLRDATRAHADALPLLQHTLQALYERRSDEGELRFDAYRGIGGLEGALAHRAEEVFATLHEDARRSLDAIFRRLIVMQQENETISARRVAWSAVDEDARALAEAFVRARLFIADLGDGEAGFRVAHEALLRQWPRARDWTHDNRHQLQARTRMRRAALRWKEEGRSADHLLNPGRPLQEALEVARRQPEDLGDDERAFLQASTRQFRRVRLLRAGAVAGLALSAIVSAVLALLASQARSEAEQRREEAMQLSDFMLVDLADKLRPLGNLKLLDSISAKALAQLERGPASRTEDLVNRSRALRTVGEVMLEEAKLEEAESAFTRAHAAAQAAVARAPDSTEALVELGIAAYWLGYHHYRQARLVDARRHWTTYLQTSERLLRLQPDNAEWRIEMSYALNNLGAVARDQGRIEEALGYFGRSAALKAAVLATRPDDGALRYDLIDTQSWISSGEVSMGRLQQAAAGHAEQIAALRTLVADRADALVWQRRLATLLLSSSDVAISLGRLDEAKMRIEESIARITAVIAREPDNKVWKRDLILAHLEAGDVARFRRDPLGRRAHAVIAQRLIRDMQAAGDASLALRRLNAASSLQIALLHADVVDAADTGASLDNAVLDLERIVRDADGGVSDTFALAKALIHRGRHRATTGKAADAGADWRRAIGLLDAMARTSKDANVVAPWVAAHALLGDRRRVETRIAWLAEIGYRDPDYLSGLDTARTSPPDTGNDPHRH